MSTRIYGNKCELIVIVLLSNASKLPNRYQIYVLD